MVRWFLINNTACDAATGKLTGECQTYWSCSDDENVGHLCIGHRIVFSFRFSHISLCSDESILVRAGGWVPSLDGGRCDRSWYFLEGEVDRDTDKHESSKSGMTHACLCLCQNGIGITPRLIW